jgi:hypothetical protein
MLLINYQPTTLPLHFRPFFWRGAVLEFELRALHLLNRCSKTLSYVPSPQFLSFFFFDGARQALYF